MLSVTFNYLEDGEGNGVDQNWGPIPASVDLVGFVFIDVQGAGSERSNPDGTDQAVWTQRGGRVTGWLKVDPSWDFLDIMVGEAGRKGHPQNFEGPGYGGGGPSGEHWSGNSSLYDSGGGGGRSQVNENGVGTLLVVAGGAGGQGGRYEGGDGGSGNTVNGSVGSTGAVGGLSGVNASETGSNGPNSPATGNAAGGAGGGGYRGGSAGATSATGSGGGGGSGSAFTNTPQNEIQRVRAIGGTSGTFLLHFDSATTATIAYNATAAAIQTALEALSNIAPGDIVVTGGPANTADVFVEFTGNYEFEDVPQMVPTDNVISASVTVTTTQGGSSGYLFGELRTDGFRGSDAGVYAEGHGKVVISWPDVAAGERLTDVTCTSII